MQFYFILYNERYMPWPNQKRTLGSAERDIMQVIWDASAP